MLKKKLVVTAASQIAVKNNSSKRLALSAAVAATLLTGYGPRQAYAGACTGKGGTYVCDGAAGADTTQSLDVAATPLAVTTNAGFGLSVATGHALYLKSTGFSLSFTDSNNANITGAQNGIYARNGGAGNTNITTTGMVTGLAEYGIRARNAGISEDLIINAAAVTGAKHGIRAVNDTSNDGSTSITTTGLVTGLAEDGIYVYNNIGSFDLTIKTAAVTGAKNGINVTNEGKGSTSITTTGLVTGLAEYGIDVYNKGSDLTINTAAVTGAKSGINATNQNAGDTSITTTGMVTGLAEDGIYAYNRESGNLTINTAAVTGANFGISARKYYGSGGINITTTGMVTGLADDGIYAYNYEGGSLTIKTAAVKGAKSGITAVNFGFGATGSLTITGAVTGGSNAGVALAGSFDTTTLNSGAAVSATSGIAIGVGTQNSTTITANSGSSITGSIKGSSKGSKGGTNEVILMSGSTLNVHTGSPLVVEANVTNNGTINLQNNTIDAPASITGNFTGGGQIKVDADFATDTADVLNIGGDVLAGGTQVAVNDISTGAATGNDVKVIEVGGATNAGDFALAAPVVNGAFNYNTLVLEGNKWVLKTIGGTSDGTRVPVYTPFSSSFEVLGRSLLTAETLPSLSKRTQYRQSREGNTGANSGDGTSIDAPLWLRIVGGYRDIDSNSSTTTADFDTKHWLAQVGIDFTVADNSNGRFVAGINAGYGEVDTDVNARAGNSNIDTDRYSVGVSGTWYAPNGFYVDTQLQRSWLKTDLSAGGVGAGKVKGVDGDGYGASIEVGKNILLNDSLSITPQAQLAYARVDADKFTGANREVVKLSDSKSLTARLGAALSKRFTADGATRGYMIANVIHEFEDETQVDVSGATLTNAVDDWTGELGVGLTHGWVKGTTQYEFTTAITGSTSLNNVGDSNAVQGEVGFKVNF